MKPDNLTKQEMIDYIQEKYSGFMGEKRQILRSETASNFFPEKLNEYKAQGKVFTEGKLKNRSEKYVRERYRDIKYLENLVSNTLEGAEAYSKNFQPISDYLKTLSEEEKQLFWKQYSKVYEAVKQSGMEKYRYEVMEVLKDFNREIFDIEDIPTIISDYYFMTTKELAGVENEEYERQIFTSFLQELY